MKILIVTILFIVFVLWACCVAAGRADRALHEDEGKQLQCITYGVEMKRCSECERADLSRVVEEIQKELDESAGFASEMEYRAGLYRVLDIIEEVTKG